MAINLTSTIPTSSISQGFSGGFSQGFAGPILKVSGCLAKPIDYALAGQMPQPSKLANRIDGGMSPIMRSVFNE